MSEETAGQWQAPWDALPSKLRADLRRHSLTDLSDADTDALIKAAHRVHLGLAPLSITNLSGPPTPPTVSTAFARWIEKFGHTDD